MLSFLLNSSISFDVCMSKEIVHQDGNCHCFYLSDPLYISVIKTNKTKIINTGPRLIGVKTLSKKVMSSVQDYL